MTHPRLVAPVDRFEDLGVFEIAQDAAAGETSLDVPLRMESGSWRAWYLGSESADDLVDEGIADDDAPEQLLLVHAGAEPPTKTAMPELEHVASIPIEGAGFTVACTSLRSALGTEGGFYDHLDGVHGVLRCGRGLHLMLDGDGQAEIWCDPAGRVLLIDLT